MIKAETCVCCGAHIEPADTFGNLGNPFCFTCWFEEHYEEPWERVLNSANPADGPLAYWSTVAAARAHLLASEARS